MSTIWGSVVAEGAINGTVDDAPVAVDVAVGDAEDYRIAAWTEDTAKNVAVVLDRPNALKLRNALNEALDQGTWAV